MKRLNIFVDESGDFAFNTESSELYVVSFTFHEQNDNIKSELEILNNKLEKLKYTNMIHMADLIMKRGDYSHYSIEQRKKLFNAIYQFSRRIPAKYSSVVVDKRFINKTPQLRYKLKSEIENLMQNNIEYFNKFDKIVLYYDNGQTMLGRVLNSVFQKFENFEHKVKFDKREKKIISSI